MKPDVKLSLICTVYNEFGSIFEFLESYVQQTRYADEFIIVDGGSNDGTYELLNKFLYENSHLNVRVIRDESCNKSIVRGPIGRGRNVAIKNSRFDWIVSTDAGCILDKYWLSTLYARILSEEFDVIGGYYKFQTNNEFQKIYEEAMFLASDKINESNFLPSSRNIAFKKNLWSQLGGYPEDSLGGEDTVFSIGIKNICNKFLFEPNAIVQWSCPDSLGNAFKKQVIYGKGDGYYTLNPIMSILAYIRCFLPITHLLKIHKGKPTLLKYFLLLTNQYGYTLGILQRLKILK